MHAPDIAFNWADDPKVLRRKYVNSDFDKIFFKRTYKDVIRTLSPQLIVDPQNLIYDDNLVYERLIEPLEKFICDLDEDASAEQVQAKLDHLRSLKQPNKLCRRILKAGDVFFSCNDCGYDKTCVICIDCFHKSAHKDHNYRMSNSDGGGCCDCGDTEAWKQHYACANHMVENQTNLTLEDFQDVESRARQIDADKKSILDKIGTIPENVATRYFLICQAALHYARTMIAWTDNSFSSDFILVPAQLERCFREVDQEDDDISELTSSSSDAKNFFTVVFNDEVHTYDHVINTFVKVIKCSKMSASIMASTISREGRSLIYRGISETCQRTRDLVVNTRDGGQGPLKVKVIHGRVLAHQAYALKLIEWIQRMSTVCDAFRVLTAYTLLGGFDRLMQETNPDDMTLLEKVMLSNTNYWKMARIDWNELFVNVMLTEYSIKSQFARLLTRNYPTLMSDYIHDDHDHSVSILIMTTQLYTVPSLICMLLEEEDALKIIASTLYTTCKNVKREVPALNYENRATFDLPKLKRGLSSVSDMEHLVNIKPTKWSEALLKNVSRGLEKFLDILELMQGMDSVKRQTGQHIEYEPEWESGMNLQDRLSHVIHKLVTYCSYHETVLKTILRKVQARLPTFKLVRKEFYGYEVNCIQYDVSYAPVSVHLPLTRFCAALILECMKITPCDTVPYDENLVILSSSQASDSQTSDEPGEEREGSKRLSMIEIMEPSLRTEVMIAQFRSSMWRRNGYSLINQVMYFHSARMRKEMFDRDILVLQECAAMCDAKEFMIHLLNKFQLFNWVHQETTREPLVGSKALSFTNDEEVLAQTMSLGEEFLQLLLTIVSERYRVGIGQIEEADIMKNEIIQILCIGPSTKSEICQKLHCFDDDIECIKSVANLRRSTESSTGKYELMEELYDRFNPFFYHYVRRHQSAALDSQLRRKKLRKESLICCPPPNPVPLTKQFINLKELLKCEITLVIIRKVLNRTFERPEDAVECSCETKANIKYTASDLQLDQCLHLLGLGLWEQERDPINFRFIDAAYFEQIFSSLKDCYEKAKRSKDLIFWLMIKTDKLMKTIELDHPNELDDHTRNIFSKIRECNESILSTCDDNKQEMKKRNSELAAQRKERIMAMMKTSQNKFLTNPTNKQLVAETEGACVPSAGKPTNPTTSAHAERAARLSSLRPISKRRSQIPGSESSSQLSTVQPMETDGSVCSDLQEMDVDAPRSSSHLCILCRDEQWVGFEEPTMVLLAFIQRSTILSKNRGQRRVPNYSLTPSNQLKHMIRQQNRPDSYSFTSDNSWSFDATFMPADLFFGPHISTCGHAMHDTCWQGFYDTILKRETTRPSRNNRHVSYELEKNEILCPLCECISNATIPLLPDFNRFTSQSMSRVSIFDLDPQVVDLASDRLSSCLRALRGAVDTIEEKRHIKGITLGSSPGEPSCDKYMKLLNPKPFSELLEELNEDDNQMLRNFVSVTRDEAIKSGSCTRSLLNSISTLAERIHTIGLDLDRSVTDVNHSRTFMMTSWSIAYTIQAHERCQRFKGSPIFEDLESSKNLCLSSLLKFACGSLLIHREDTISSLLIQKLRYLLISDSHMSSSPCCLDIDVFETFVSLFLLLQKLYVNSDQQYANWTTKVYDLEYYRSLLHLMLILNMIQVSISLQNINTEDGQETSIEDDGEFKSLFNWHKEVIIASGHPNSKLPTVNERFCTEMRRRLLPFLRSCATFFYHLSHIPPPEVLKTQSAFNEGKNFIEPQQQQLETIEGKSELIRQEFAAICSYLNLPDDFRLLLASQEVRHLSRSWLRHSRVLILIKSALNEQEMAAEASAASAPSEQTLHPLKRISSHISATGSSTSESSSSIQQQTTELMPVKFIPQPHSINQLVDLPYDYSELVDKVSDFTCPSIKGEDSRTPTMCLICGVMLCSHSYCCQRDLNDLASNYQEVLQRQAAANQQERAQASESGAAGGSSPAQSAMSTLGTMGSAAALLLSAASNATSNRLSPGRLGGGSSLTGGPSGSGHIPNPNSIIHQQLVGSCTYHAHECSGGIGVFLRVRSCQILLLSGKSKGCYIPAPYIDDHGETDYGLIRGNPLYLNRQHYAKLQQMWISHAIPEQISRMLEHSHYASSINWHLH